MEIMDVTLRESVYYGKGLSNADGLNYLQKLKENVPNDWIQFIEVGYINNDENAPLHYNEEYFNKAIDICKDVYKVTAMMHVPKADITRWNPDLIKRLDLVRVVVGHHIPDELKQYVDYIHELGVQISVNITYASNLAEEKIVEEIKRANNMGVDYIFCADSSGSFSPDKTMQISKLLLENCDNMITGVHLHDHMQMAMANALTAQKEGIHMTDVSVTGAGKGGGNLKMEQGLLLLHKPKMITYERLQGLCEMIRYFCDLIGRDGDAYIQNLLDFCTGLYRLSLKDTDELEKECGTNYEKYLRLLTKRYIPFEVK